MTQYLSQAKTDTRRLWPQLALAALASTLLMGQAPGPLTNAVSMAARTQPNQLFSAPITAGGRAGTITLYGSRDTPSGRCRSFAISYGVAGGYAGEACLNPAMSSWSVRSIHPTPSAAAAAAIASHGLTPSIAVSSQHLQSYHMGKPSPPLLAPGPHPAAGGDVTFGQTIPTFHLSEAATAAGPGPSSASSIPAAQAAPVAVPVPMPEPEAGSAAPQSAPQPAAPAKVTDTPLSLSVAQHTQQMPIIYNRPPQINFEKATPVSLIVGSASIQQAVADLQVFPGTAKSATAVLSSVVTARLLGDPDAVVITARMPETQEISNLANVSWIWDIRAIKPGTTLLTLQIFDTLPVDGGTKIISVKTFNDNIIVHADLISWLRYEINRIDLIYKFLGIGTPAVLIVGVFTWWRKRRKFA
jgi:hypothetical protein